MLGNKIDIRQEQEKDDLHWLPPIPEKILDIGYRVSRLMLSGRDLERGKKMTFIGYRQFRKMREKIMKKRITKKALRCRIAFLIKFI